MNGLHAILPPRPYGHYPELTSEAQVENDARGHLIDIWAENYIVYGLWRREGERNKIYVIKVPDHNDIAENENRVLEEARTIRTGLYRSWWISEYYYVTPSERSFENVWTLPPLTDQEIINIPNDHEHQYDEYGDCHCGEYNIDFDDREHEHNWNNGTCGNCGMEHEHDDPEDFAADGYCLICDRYDEDHDTTTTENIP